MERDRFDALTRLLGRAGSRRAALGAVLGATVGGSALVTQAKKGKNKKKKNKKKAPQTCFGTESCAFPSDGQDFENCDLSFTSIASCDGCNFRRADLGGVDLEEGSFQGVSFRNANLSSADLSFTDVSGASFRDACLSGANFFGANTDGAHFGGAIFCGTILTDGSVDDSGCDDTDNCCPAVASCVKDVDCPADAPTCCNGRCVDTDTDPLNCGGCLAACFTNETCIGGECVSDCGQGCIKDSECPGDQTCCDGICCGGFFSCEPSAPGPGDVCVDTFIGGCDDLCVKDAECPENWACVDDGLCGGDTHCHPLCGTVNGVTADSKRRRGGH
jgi:hypothetical protein